MRMLKFRGLALLALMLPIPLLPMPAQAGPARQLADNLFVIPDANAKATSFWMIVKAGCRDETHGDCRGLAHYVEHLVFLGRNADHKTVAVSFFPDAQANGYTTHTTTVYTQKFPLRPEGQNGDLEKLFKFYTERLQTLDFTDDDALRERGVVRQEYALNYERSPGTGFYYTLEHDLHPAHPVGQPVIGSKDDIDNFSIEAARAFHKTWYSADNAIFVVHGPVEPDAIKALYEKYVMPLPKVAVPERAWLNARYDFTPMVKFETMTDKAIGQKSLLYAKVVLFEENNRRRLNEARGLVSAFLSSTLDGSPKDVLVDNLNLARSVSYAQATRLIAGAMQFDIQLQPADGVSDADATRAVSDYLVNLAKSGLSTKVLERLKKRSVDGWLQREKQPGDEAQAIVGWLGSHNSFQDYQERAAVLATVTPEDVNLLLTALAQPGRLVAGSMAPLP